MGRSLIVMVMCKFAGVAMNRGAQPMEAKEVIQGYAKALGTLYTRESHATSVIVP